MSQNRYMNLLKSSLPEGIIVKSFEDRISFHSEFCNRTWCRILDLILEPLCIPTNKMSKIVTSIQDDTVIDLYSVLIKGPKRTPYEDGLFFFDFQLPADYPKAPPLCHYISYCSDRLNPNLYEGGKVCVSLLGTWGGKGTEMWNPATSNLLQVIVSIQGLILVSEPYYNEAGYERQKGTQLGMENSRMYNEMVVLKLVQNLLFCYEV
ncbi:UNVERIFIED_CONTAM: (E3-independent) E2 ubiquitin-conjugating enzyme [Trichonephila clavipes]